MTSLVGEWHDLVAAETFAPGEMIACEVGAHQLALYNVGGAIYATDNVCSHAYALLTDGWLENDVVECPLHGGQFNVCTGKAVCEPAETEIRTYPVRLKDGRLQVFLPHTV